MACANRANASTGKRAQRFSGFRRGLDVQLAMGMQHDRRGQDDEERDDVGKDHADRGVDPAATQRARRLQWRNQQGLPFAIGFNFLNLLSRLPAEKEGADGGAEQGDQADRLCRIPGHRWNDDTFEHGQPEHVDNHDRGNVREQTQCQQLENWRLA